MWKDIKRKEVGVFLFLLFLSLWPSIYNGYPLIGNDTGSYLSSGHSGKIPVDRPIYYGLFVRHISLSWSLWIPVIIQNLILLLAVIVKRHPTNE